MVLKSERDVLKMKKQTKKKQIVQKSKLGESFRKFRETFPDVCSSKSREAKPLVFGRKYSFSLENFNSLSLQEESSEPSQKFSSESFKHINVSPLRSSFSIILMIDIIARVLVESVREREARAATRAPRAAFPPSAVASRRGCTAMLPWMIWQVRPGSL